LTFVLATTAGAFLIAGAIQEIGAPVMEKLLGDLPEGDADASIAGHIRTYGLTALVVLAILPSPPRTAVIACGLARIPAAQVALAVLAGRIVPATLYAAVGAKAPHLLRKIPSVDRVFREVERARGADPTEMTRFLNS
jgi:uncharacterized membrane protein YdjX (TVP38/TMEM64 family)